MSRGTVRRRLFLAILAGVMFAALMVPPPAFACSCAFYDPRDMLADSDGAMVGTFLTTAPGDGSGEGSTEDTIYRFDVVDPVKGTLPDPIDVHSAFSDFSCGLLVTPTEQYGLFLEQDESGQWRSDLCRQTSPEVVREAGEPLPTPDGSPPAVMLLGGSFGDVRVIALDSQGRTIAYGGGDGDVVGIDECPGDTHSVEVFSRFPEADGFAIRTIADLDQVAGYVLPVDAGGPDRENVTSIHCARSDGTKVFVHALDYREPLSRSRIIRVVDDVYTVMHKGSVVSMDMKGNTAFVAQGRFGRKLTKINLRTDKEKVLAELKGFVGEPQLSPDGKHLAVVSYPASGSPRVTLIDISKRPVEVDSKRVTSSEGYRYDVIWADDATLVLADANGPGGARVLDMSLAELGRFTWNSISSTVVDGVLYGVGFGSMEKATLPGGPRTDVRQLPSPITIVLESL